MEYTYVPLHKTLKRKRRFPVSVICLHTRMGISDQKISATPKGNAWHREFPRRMYEASLKGRVASAHAAVGPSGKVGVFADPATEVTYHATVLNDRSVGVELWQDSDGTIYEETLASAVVFVEHLCKVLKLPRVIITSEKIDVRVASPDRLRKYEYVEGGQLGRLFAGVCGHRNVTRNRGKGDPGDIIIQRLLAAGFEAV